MNSPKETVETESEIAVCLNSVSMRFVVPRTLSSYALRPFQSAACVQALRDVRMTVRAGERIALFGVNGAGKTTVLKLISGLILPSSGEVLIRGRSTGRHDHKVRRDVGYVINEERSFYWRLTGSQNLEFIAGLDNLTGSRARDCIRELLRQVGLAQAADRRVADYSAGMKQRLAIARGLLTAPNILLLDEPTRSLDPLGVISIHELLKTTFAVESNGDSRYESIRRRRRALRSYLCLAFGRACRLGCDGWPMQS